MKYKNLEHLRDEPASTQEVSRRLGSDIRSLGEGAIARTTDNPYRFSRLRRDIFREEVSRFETPSEADKWLHTLISKFPANIDSLGRPRQGHARQDGTWSTEMNPLGSTLLNHGVTVYDGQGSDYHDPNKRFDMISFHDPAGGLYTISSRLPEEDRKYTAASIAYTTNPGMSDAYTEMLYLFRTHDVYDRHVKKHSAPWKIQEGLARYIRNGSIIEGDSDWTSSKRCLLRETDDSHELSESYLNITKNARTTLDNIFTEIELS